MPVLARTQHSRPELVGSASRVEPHGSRKMALEKPLGYLAVTSSVQTRRPGQAHWQLKVLARRYDRKLRRHDCLLRSINILARREV